MKRMYKCIVVFMICIVSGSLSNEILIKEIASKVNIENIKQIIKDLSGENTVIVDGQEIKFINRYYKSEQNILAAKYIANKFAEYGYDANFVSIFPNNWKVSLETAYAIKPGKTKPKEVVLFSANFDTPYSLSVDPLTDIRPGANVNASGIAIMLEAARIMKSYENEKTIVFAGFDDVYDSGYGPGHLLDSLMKSDIHTQVNIFLSSLGRELFHNEVTFHTYDSVKSSINISTFKESMEVLNLKTNKSKIVLGFATLRSQLPNISDITFTNAFRTVDSVASGANDRFENLNMGYLEDNSKIAISTLSVLAEVISKSTSVHNNNNNNNYGNFLKLFPNPASDYITIQFHPSEGFEPSEGYNVQIFDMLGLEVAQTPSSVNNMKNTQTGASELLRIDVSHLPAGVYFIKIVGCNGACSTIEKFVKMR